MHSHYYHMKTSTHMQHSTLQRSKEGWIQTAAINNSYSKLQYRAVDSTL